MAVAWFCGLMLLASHSYAQRGPRAVLDGSYEADLADNAAQLAYEDSVCGKFGGLLSPPEKKGAKHEAVADPQFFLLPPRAQTVLLRRGNPKETISIVFFDTSGGKLVAGTFKDLKNGRGLNITAGRAKKAVSLIDKDKAAEFAAQFKK